MKNYLESENARNQRNHKLFETLLKRACGSDKAMVLIGHHLTFELPEEAPNEIPSADCLMFDHDLMKVVFPDDYLNVIQTLAMTPTAARDAMLAHILEERELPIGQINSLSRA